ncbi:MAG: hypothetical protein IJD75_02840 [Clostridia bacterium]|nr:hypothetical protein [Clostridia bacterium]
MNEQKKLLNYFKKWDGAGTLGIGMLAAGALILWLGMSYFSYILSVFLLGSGTVVFLYGNIGRGNETTVNDFVKKNCEKVTFPELTDNHALHKRTLGEPAECEFGGFEMRRGLLFKKKKDASLISSEYTYAKLIVLKDAFYLKKLTFSLVTEEKQEQTFDISFDSIQRIEVLRDTFFVGKGEKNEYRAKTCFIAISYGEGEQLLLPTPDNAYVEELAETLKKKSSLE